MYDELVKRLRHSANIAERGLITPPSELRAAADAIEELTALSRRQEVELVKLTGELASKPRWIPVTEALPEIRKVVFITDGIDVGTGWMNQGWWNTSFANIRDAVTHWMPLPQPPKEET